jgi:hypothetical protein
MHAACRCAAPDDATIPTTDKHIFQRAFITDDGHLLAAAAGTSDGQRWAANRGALVQAACTFRPAGGVNPPATA